MIAYSLDYNLNECLPIDWIIKKNDFDIKQPTNIMMGKQNLTVVYNQTSLKKEGNMVEKQATREVWYKKKMEMDIEKIAGYHSTFFETRSKIKIIFLHNGLKKKLEKSIPLSRIY